MPALAFRPATNEDINNIRLLIFSILDEYDLEPSPETTDRDLNDIEAFYTEGVFDVLTAGDGEIIGTLGLKPIRTNTVELRKMYLQPGFRGRGIGVRLLKHAIARAKELGATRIELETASVLKEAIALYKKFGFMPIEHNLMEERCDLAFALDL